MGMLKSIHTLLGHSYRARDYNDGFDNKESGAAYYALERDSGSNHFICVESLTDQGEPDTKMPGYYLIDSDLPNVAGMPALEVAVHTQKAFSSAKKDEGVQTGQLITTLPVAVPEGIKGVFQFRSSARGVAETSITSQDRLALAQYVTDTFAPFLEPRKALETGSAHRKLNTMDGTLEFLTGMKDRWQAAIKNWSQETYQHTQRVAELSDLIAHKINDADSGPMAAIKMPEKEMQLFKLSAELHDLGKLYTPRSILESGVPVPGVRYELDKKETEIMERHSQDVFDVFDIPGFAHLQKVRDITSAHHIFADGSAGYPDGVRQKLLEEGGIPFEAKVLAVSDIFEALTADREYREGVGLPLSTTLRIMGAMAKKGQIDGQVLRFCVEQNIFEEFTKNRGYISRLDPEFFEKLGYSNADINAAAQFKAELSADANIPADKLEGLLRLSTKKLFDRVNEDISSPPKAGDFTLTIQMARIITERKIEFHKKLKQDSADKGLQIDAAYSDKILALSEREASFISQDKKKVIATLMPSSHTLDEAAAEEKLEQSVKKDIARTRGFYMGVDPKLAFEPNVDLDRIKYVLTERENEQLELARKAILTDIPAQPLSSSERFTLFQPQHYRASENTDLPKFG